jgi:tetratricopeptide (TPR) repeat protein
MRGRRLLRGVVAATATLGLGLALFSVSGLLASPQGEVAPPPAVTVAPPSNLAVLQERLRRLPNDWMAWSALGSAYLDEAVATGDPAYYNKVEGALQRSLALHPQENAAALTGQAALAASRHDFSTALRLARTSQRFNSYSTANQGVLVDALVELGRYDQAKVELQRMVDVKPSVPAFTRVSYYRELHGDIEGAREALERADALASRPNDQAFIARYLGELAFSRGDLPAALEHIERGLRAAPRDAALLALRGRARMAAGDTPGGLQDYSVSTGLVPLSTTIADYAAALRAAGRAEEARQQDALVRATYQLLRDNGSNVDLELALYEADRGNGAVALPAARREHDRRVSVHTEDALGWALHAAGEDRSALKHARAAERLSTTNAAFAYHRGMIEHSLGMKSAAQKSLQRALRINPYFSPAGSAKARQALQELAR